MAYGVETRLVTLHDHEEKGAGDTVLARVDMDCTSIGVSFMTDKVDHIAADVLIEYNNGVVRVYVWDEANIDLGPIQVIPILELEKED